MTKNPAPHLQPDAIGQIRSELLRWYDEEHRPLPWRTHPSEYKTVISEIMLQQTQVAAVIPFFEDFIAEFPDFKALAEASEEAVLRAWSGLGYYRRARNLKRAAEKIVREHDGRLPLDARTLATLPGFGAYTVGAVGSIALGLRLPLVDGNVRRVIARLLAMPGDLTKGAGARRLWSICGELVPEDRPGDFNQALMELGATVCQPREPLCLICPLFEVCEARRRGEQEKFPQPPRRPQLRRVREIAVALMRGDKLLVLQRGEEQSFAGMWELPRLSEREIAEDTPLNPDHVLFELLRLRPGRVELLGEAESTFTHHRITTELYRAQALGAQRIRRQRHIAHRWITVGELADLPASKAQRRLFAMLGADVR